MCVQGVVGFGGGPLLSGVVVGVDSQFMFNVNVSAWIA